MTQFLWSVLFLIVAAGCNWLLGFVEKLGVQKIEWNWNAFLCGLAKVGVVVGVLLCIGFIWEYSGVDLSGAGFEPLTIVNAGMVVYWAKASKHVFSMLKILPGAGERKEDKE